MLTVIALLTLTGWYNTLTTETGKSLVSFAVDLLGTLALTAIMVVSVLWSLFVLWGQINGV